MEEDIGASAEKPRIMPSPEFARYSLADSRSLTHQRPGPPSTWIQLVRRIDDEVTALLSSRETWQTFRDVAALSPVVQAQPYFALWVSDLYGPAQALGVRKIADRDAKSGSLAQLLRKLAAEPEALTREWFIGGCEVAMASQLDETFTRIADPEFTGHLDSSIPANDLTALRKATAKLGKYVNQHVAHAQLVPDADIPTYEDLDSALDFISQLVRKYLLLLTGGDRVHGPAIHQEPWQRVFSEAWLVPGEGAS